MRPFGGTSAYSLCVFCPGTVEPCRGQAGYAASARPARGDREEETERRDKFTYDGLRPRFVFLTVIPRFFRPLLRLFFESGAVYGPVPGGVSPAGMLRLTGKYEARLFGAGGKEDRGTGKTAVPAAWAAMPERIGKCIFPMSRDSCACGRGKTFFFPQAASEGTFGAVLIRFFPKGGGADPAGGRAFLFF